MDITKQENLITKSRLERDRLENTSTTGESSPFYQMSIGYGLLAGVLMGTFLAFGGFYITGDQALFGIAKYLILAVVLGVLLTKIKVASKDGATFKDGISYGFITTITAALATAVVTLLVNGIGDTAVVQTASGGEISSFILAGIVFFEGLVAGLILVFIWLQLLKDRQQAV